MLHDYSIISLYAIRCIRAKIAVFAEIRNTHARKKSEAQVIRQLIKAKPTLHKYVQLACFLKKLKTVHSRMKFSYKEEINREIN